MSTLLYRRRHLQAIVRRYQESGEPWPASAHQMAEWAIRTKLWVRSQSSIVDECAELLTRAMREDYVTDPQGRLVRAKHAARVERNGVQTTLWDDIRTADRVHMEIAFQQRRQQIVGDCRQLKTDADSYNENANKGRAIQIVFDFRPDLAEIEAAAALA